MTLEQIYNALNEVYKSLTEKQRLLAAYQLRFVANEDLLYKQVPNIFKDDDTSKNSFMQSITDLLKKIEDGEIEINLPILELLICLYHMEEENIHKVVEDELSSQLSEYDYLRDKMLSAGEKVPEESESVKYWKRIQKEREDELKEFYKAGQIAKEVLEYYS